MLLLLLLQFLFTLVHGNELRPRVVGGTDAKLDDYPFIVMLIIEHKLSDGLVTRLKACTGSLISERWVLTAAHCDGKWIRYADNSVPFDDKKMFVDIIKHVRHKGYTNTGILKYGKWHHVTSLKDIMLHKVRNRTSITSYGTVSGVDYNTLIGRSATVIGFGLTYVVPWDAMLTKFLHDRSWSNVSMPLQCGDAVISKCPKFKTFGPNICVSATCNRDMRLNFGDSGSPLLVDGKIVGVLSYEYLATRGAYTAISPYLNWIYSVLNGN